MIHPRDQWFTVYRRLRVEVAKGKIIAIRVFEPTPGEPAHVVHTDAYHPDWSIRRKHAQQRFETGEVETACGRKITSRDIVISASPGEPCAECLKAQGLSSKDHEEAQARVDARHAEQRVFEADRAQLLEAEIQDAIESSNVLVEKAVVEEVALEAAKPGDPSTETES